MSADGTPPLFTAVELESYLPTGWELAAGAAGWDARGRRWTTVVRDGARMEWSLVVTARRAAELGRLEALRRAFDELVRHRLG